MKLPLQITFYGVTQSDAIEQYVRARAAKLDALDPRVMGCRVAIEMPHKHAQHGEHYRVRVDITVPGGELAVGHVPGMDRTFEDLYAAVDVAFDEAGRRLQDFVRRQRGDVKPHEKARHGHVSKLFAYEGYGFVRTEEGDELYFHRNSVLDGAFDRLRVGSRVRFVEASDEAGPHASTIAIA